MAGALTPVAMTLMTLTTRPLPRQRRAIASSQTNVQRPSSSGRLRKLSTSGSSSFVGSETWLLLIPLHHLAQKVGARLLQPLAPPCRSAYSFLDHRSSSVPTNAGLLG